MMTMRTFTYLLLLILTIIGWLGIFIGVKVLNKIVEHDDHYYYNYRMN